METLTLVIFGYLVGSISFAYIFSRIFKGIDIRTVGDHNAGTANVIRHVGLWAGILTVIFDIGKGIAVVLIARYFTDYIVTVYLCGAVAVIGHAFPIFYGFKGGRGVATTIGIFLALMPFPTLTLLVLIGIIVFITGSMNLAVTSLFVPLLILNLLIREDFLLSFYILFLGCLLWLFSLVLDKRLSIEEREEGLHLNLRHLNKAP